jgi:hypothetical protein
MRPTMCQLGPKLRANFARLHLVRFLMRLRTNEISIVRANARVSPHTSQAARPSRRLTSLEFGRPRLTPIQSSYKEVA